MPLASQDVLNALHERLEAHHYVPESSHDHGHEHIVDADEADHPAHFDIVSYYDNLHIDLKNPPPAMMAVSKVQIQDMPFIMATMPLMDEIMYWPQRQAQGPPPPDIYVASLGLPVYLATQRLRI